MEAIGRTGLRYLDCLHYEVTSVVYDNRKHWCSRSVERMEEKCEGRHGFSAHSVGGK